MKRSTYILTGLLLVAVLLIFITRGIYESKLDKAKSDYISLDKKHKDLLDNYTKESAIYRDSISFLLSKNTTLDNQIDSLKNKIKTNEGVSTYFDNITSDELVKYWTRKYTYLQRRE